MTYAQRWILATALRQAEPTPFETGDVPQDDASSSSPEGITFSPEQVKESFQNMARNARLLVVIGAGIGVVVGGAVGFAIGRTK